MAEAISLKSIIGEDLLNKIQGSYLNYLESSAAIYEVNGDYASALFSSRYCNFLNQASRNMAGANDEEALKSGKWICHQDCWATSLKSMKDKKPCEMECSGGITIYAAPVIAAGMVIGSSNAGVSNPPTDKEKIKEIAGKYRVDPAELLEIAKEYSPRPQYVLDAAKNHLLVAAGTFADIFLHKQAQEKEREFASEKARMEAAERSRAMLEEKARKLTDSRTAMIHMLKRLERTGKELAAARDYTDNIIKSMIDALVVVGSDGTIKTINKATSDLLGYNEEDLIGKPVATIFREEEALFKGARLQRLIKEGSVRDYDLTYKAKSGKEIPVSFSGSVMRQVICSKRDKPTGDCPEFKKKKMHCEKMVGIVGIARDMREYNRLLAELRNNLEELKSTQAQLMQAGKMSAVGDLAAGMAHELNQPFMAIATHIEILLMDDAVASGSELDQRIRKIKDQFIRLSKIVKRVTDYSTGRTGEYAHADPNVPIHEGYGLFAQQLKDHNIEVTLDLQEHLPQAYMDRYQVQEVVINLLVNSRDAVDEVYKQKDGGKINIVTMELENKKAVLVVVIDNGVPIEKEAETKIFNPFFTTKPPGKGTGLGLSICHTIIKDHHGLIGFTNLEDDRKGFYFVLPLDKETNLAADKMLISDITAELSDGGTRTRKAELHDGET